MTCIYQYALMLWLSINYVNIIMQARTAWYTSHLVPELAASLCSSLSACMQGLFCQSLSASLCSSLSAMIAGLGEEGQEGTERR